MIEASVVIPVWNHWEDLTAPLLNRLRGDPDVRERAELIVVDDGSGEDTLECYAARDGVRYVLRADNGGFAPACNDGARVARGDTLVFLNSDTEPEPGWLPPLLDAVAHGAGMAGSRIQMPPGERWRAAESQGVTGACFATPRALWERLGGFDTAAGFAHGGEELDYGLRAAALGYPVALVPDSVVLHRVGVTSQDQTPEWRKAHYDRAVAVLESRYGPAWWDVWRDGVQLAVPVRLPVQVA